MRNEGLITRIMSVAKTKQKPAINTFINPRKTFLTADMLNTFAGCEEISIEEANDIIASLEMLSVLLLEFVMDKKNEHI